MELFLKSGEGAPAAVKLPEEKLVTGEEEEQSVFSGMLARGGIGLCSLVGCQSIGDWGGGGAECVLRYAGQGGHRIV